MQLSSFLETDMQLSSFLRIAQALQIDFTPVFI